MGKGALIWVQQGFEEGAGCRSGEFTANHKTSRCMRRVFLHPESSTKTARVQPPPDMNVLWLGVYSLRFTQGVPSLD